VAKTLRIRQRRLAAGKKDQPGRRTPPPSGRYTPPTPREVKRSPRWYPWVLLSLLVIGIAMIILNYVDVLPSSPTNWYTVGGLIAILVAAMAATRYH
jgi:hypothetical protein